MHFGLPADCYLSKLGLWMIVHAATSQTLLAASGHIQHESMLLNTTPSLPLFQKTIKTTAKTELATLPAEEYKNSEPQKHKAGAKRPQHICIVLVIMHWLTCTLNFVIVTPMHGALFVFNKAWHKMRDSKNSWQWIKSHRNLCPVMMAMI